MHKDSMAQQALSGKPRARLYVGGSALGAGCMLAIEEGQAHYLLSTLRLREGEQVMVFNGRDGEWLATAQEIRKKSLSLRVAVQRAGQKYCPDIGLLFAPVKNEKIDFMVKRAVELGVSFLQPVMTRHTIVSRVNLSRLRANAIEAAEQCERMDVPELREPAPLLDMLGSWDTARTLLYCDESGKGAPLKQLLPVLPPQKPCAVLTGPEGGFSREEQERLRSLPFVKAMSLGPRILRAETAALAALANVQAWLGDWEEPPHFISAA